MAAVAIGYGVVALVAGAGSVTSGLLSCWHGIGLYNPPSYTPSRGVLQDFLSNHRAYARCLMAIGLIGTIFAIYLLGSVAWTAGAIAFGYGTNTSLGLIALKMIGGIAIGGFAAVAPFFILEASALKARFPESPQ